MVDFYLQSIFSTKRGGYFEYKPAYISALPNLEPALEVQLELTNLVQQILTQKQADPTADTTALEDEIDLLMYCLYGLSYAEVLLGDEAFVLSEAEYDQLPSPM